MAAPSFSIHSAKCLLGPALSSVPNLVVEAGSAHDGGTSLHRVESRQMVPQEAKIVRDVVGKKLDHRRFEVGIVQLFCLPVLLRNVIQERFGTVLAECRVHRVFSQFGVAATERLVLLKR